jgi:hypothetical protein
MTCVRNILKIMRTPHINHTNKLDINTVSKQSISNIEHVRSYLLSPSQITNFHVNNISSKFQKYSSAVITR